MLVRLIACAILSTAIAQTALAQGAKSSQQTTSGAGSSQTTTNLPHEIQQKLQNDGFSDVKVVPSSFLVQAKDKNGDPVTMIIGPHSMTMLTEMSGDNNPNTGSASPSNKGSSSSTPTKKD